LYKLLKGNHHSLKLQNAFNKYGINSIEFDVIDECPTELTTEIEQYWLNNLDTFKKGYNSCPLAKSNLGFKWSKESREKLSASKKGKAPWNKGIKTYPPSEETRQKLSLANKGISKGPMSEKQKKDIRNTLLKRNAELRNLLTLS
jgi:group I intron endonuclease